MADFEAMAMALVDQHMAGVESIMQCEPVITIPGVYPSTAQFLFEKELKRSDVGPTNRVVIPKVLYIDGRGFLQRNAERYLPPLTDKRGFFMLVDDMDIKRIWTFHYRYWNNNSTMFILEKTGDFVKEHGLRAGDFIMIYKDDTRGTYGIRAKKTASLGAPRQNEEDRSMSNHPTPVIWDEIDSYFLPKSSSISNLLGGVVPGGENFGEPLSFQPTTFPPYNF